MTLKKIAKQHPTEKALFRLCNYIYKSILNFYSGIKVYIHGQQHIIFKFMIFFMCVGPIACRPTSSVIYSFHSQSSQQLRSLQTKSCKVLKLSNAQCIFSFRYIRFPIMIRCYPISTSMRWCLLLLVLQQESPCFSRYSLCTSRRRNLAERLNNDNSRTFP